MAVVVSSEIYYLVIYCNLPATLYLRFIAKVINLAPPDLELENYNMQKIICLILVFNLQLRNEYMLPIVVNFFLLILIFSFLLINTHFLFRFQTWSPEKKKIKLFVC